MPNISLQSYLDHQLKFPVAGRQSPITRPEVIERAERETGAGGLHEQIMEHCGKQWPRWKYRHARTDKKTTEELGTEDFTIFLPGNKTLHVECKARNEKPSPEQLIWATELRMLGHTVHFVWSFEEFLALVTAEPAEHQCPPPPAEPEPPRAPLQESKPQPQRQDSPTLEAKDANPPACPDDSPAI